MKKVLFLLTLSLLYSTTSADIANCADVYVGSISVEQGITFRVIFLNSAQDSLGSYWVNFSHFNDEDKKAALSLLTAAKVAKLPVSIKTQESDGCGIATGQRLANKVVF